MKDHSALQCSCRQEAGFTLVELVMTIVIVSVLAAIAAVIILQGVTAFTSEQARGNVHAQARLATERMAREARLIRSCGDIAGPVNPSATLSFTDINGAAIAFTVAGGNLSRGAVLLAQGITSAQPFRFLDRAGNPTVSCAAPNDIWYVEINIAGVQGSETLGMRTRVHPRNF